MLRITQHAKERCEEYNVDQMAVRNIDVPFNLKSATLIEIRPKCRIFAIATENCVLTVVKFHRTPTPAHLNVDVVYM